MSAERTTADVGCGACGHEWTQPMGEAGDYDCPRCDSGNTCSKHTPMWLHFEPWSRYRRSVEYRAHTEGQKTERLMAICADVIAGRPTTQTITTVYTGVDS